MLTPIKCPSCGNHKGVPESFLGKNVRCGNCKTTFVCAAAVVKSKSLGDKVSDALDRQVHYATTPDTDYSTVCHYPSAMTLPHRPVTARVSPAASAAMAQARAKLWREHGVMLALAVVVLLGIAAFVLWLSGSLRGA